MEHNDERLFGREALARVQRELDGAEWLPEWEIPCPEPREPGADEQTWVGLEAPAWAVRP